MPHILHKTGVAACALALLGFAGQANATTRPMLNSGPGLTVLIEDEENAEVKNLLDPAADAGAPAESSGTESEAMPEAREGAEMKAKPDTNLEQQELDTQDR